MNIDHLGYLSVGSQMRRVYEKLQFDADKIYQRAGINFKSSWFPIYYTLANSTRALTVQEITNEISYSRITVKNVVRELEAEGYAEIMTNPSDQRSKLIQLTSRGKSLEAPLLELWECFEDYLKNLFGQDKNSFLEQLALVNKKLSTSSMEKEILQDYYQFSIRNATTDEFNVVGDLLVKVYSSIKGFPSIKEQPTYYEMLRNVGHLTENPNIELFVCVSRKGDIGGAVIYFHDMKDYGSGGTGTQEKDACGFRLLAVSPDFQGLGLGKQLTEYCIDKGKSSSSKNMVIHTTDSMKLAWGMYERLGFVRAKDLDFMQGNLPVYGFRLDLLNEPK